MGERAQEIMLQIPQSRYEELLDTEIRVSLLMKYVRRTPYSLSRREVADYLGFELAEAEGKE